MTTTLKLDAGRVPSAAPAAATAAESHVLITEQPVLGIATATTLTPAKTRRFRDALRAFASAVGGWLASAVKPPTKPVYPARHVWLENALMSREMDRL